MTGMRDQSGLPTALDVLESVLILITGAALAGPILPGFTLCVAGLIVLAVAVLAPLVVLVTLAGAILAIPYLVVGSIRRIRARRTASAPVSIAFPSLG
jgi:hypothetical protein